jgi:hypothetical protein
MEHFCGTAGTVPFPLGSPLLASKPNSSHTRSVSAGPGQLPGSAGSALRPRFVVPTFRKPRKVGQPTCFLLRGISVAGWDYSGAFSHKNDGALGGAGTVLHASGNGESLAGSEFDGAALELNDEFSFDDVEELILVIVLVPMELAMHDPETHHAVIDAAQGLVPPGFLAGVGDGLHVNEFKRGEAGSEIN